MSQGNVRATLEAVAQRLREAGCETPEVDAELLVAHVLGTTRSAVRADGTRALADEALRRLDELVARRELREPLPYVLGEWGFRRLTLKVDSRALVPRPETETLVERCLELVRDLAAPRILDVGTGTGAIALALADEHPGARVTGIDVSPPALDLARENAERLRRPGGQVASCNLGSSVEFVAHDLFAGLPDGPWDLVVSNPPYVRPDEIETLAPEVRDWEPRVALLGTGVTEAIVEHARPVLRRGGALVLEVADGDAARVAELLRRSGLRDVAVTRDLSSRERVVEGIA